MWSVLVTGSRDLESADVMWHYLGLTLNKHPLLTIVHGAARGADRYAHMWCDLSQDLRDPDKMVIEACREPGTPGYPANWGDGKFAGNARNQEMVNLEPRPDVVYAFPMPQSRGTYDCMARAWVKGIPIYEFSPNYNVHKLTEAEGELLARKHLHWGSS